MVCGQILPTDGIYLGLTRLLKRYELVADVLKIRKLLIYKSKSQVTKQPKAQKRWGAGGGMFLLFLFFDLEDLAHIPAP